MAKSRGMFTGAVATTGHRIESQEQIDTAYAVGRYARDHDLPGAETADLLRALGVDSEPIVGAALARHGYATDAVALA